MAGARALGGYPTAYRAGSNRYQSGPGLSLGTLSTLMDQVFDATNNLEQALRETERREGSKGKSAIPRSFLRQGLNTRQTTDALRKLSRLNPMRRAGALANLAKALAQALGLEPSGVPTQVLDFPGFTLKADCGKAVWPYLNPATKQGHFPASSLGCIAGQYPLAPEPIGSPYTARQLSDGLATWYERYDADLDPRCATAQVYQPIPQSGVQPGDSPYSTYVVPAPEPQVFREPERDPRFGPSPETLPVKWWNQRTPETNPEREVGPQPVTRTQPQRLEPPRPPGIGVRERKAFVRLRSLASLVNVATESLDAIEALFKALPCSVQCATPRKIGKDGKLEGASRRGMYDAVWHHWREIDIAQAAFELAWNAMEDRAYGLTGRGMGRAYGQQRNPAPSQVSNESNVGSLPLDELKPEVYRALTGKEYRKCKCGRWAPTKDSPA